MKKVSRFNLKRLGIIMEPEKGMEISVKVYHRFVAKFTTQLVA